jgi:hypothetical protein
MLAQLEVKGINSKTFKDYYRFSRTFQSWTIFFSPIQGLPRLFKACGHPDFVCIKFKLKISIYKNSSIVSSIESSPKSHNTAYTEICSQSLPAVINLASPHHL